MLHRGWLNHIDKRRNPAWELANKSWVLAVKRLLSSQAEIDQPGADHVLKADAEHHSDNDGQDYRRGDAAAPSPHPGRPFKVTGAAKR